MSAVENTNAVANTSDYQCYCLDTDENCRDISMFIEQQCGCNLHYHCLVSYLHHQIGDRSNISVNGIVCPNGRECKSFKAINDNNDENSSYYMTPVDLDNIVEYGCNHSNLKHYLDQNNCEELTHDAVNIRCWFDEMQDRKVATFTDADYDIFIISTTKACPSCGKLLLRLSLFVYLLFLLH